MTEMHPLLLAKDYEIIVIAVNTDNYYLLKGEEHLSQMLLVDGTFPYPICCLRFDSLLDIHLTFGEELKLGSLWAVHPAIAKRLIDEEKMIETKA